MIFSKKVNHIVLHLGLILGLLLSTTLAANTAKLNNLLKTTPVSKQAYSTEVIENVTEDMLLQTKIEVALAENKLNSLMLELKEAEQTIARTRANIRELESKLQNAKLASTEVADGDIMVKEVKANLAYQHSLLDLEQTRRNVLNKSMELAERNLAKEIEQRDKLASSYQLQHQQEQRKNLEQLAQHLQEEQKGWLDKLTAYNQQLQALSNKDNPLFEEQKLNLEIHILEAEEKSSINHFNLILAQLSNQYEGLIKSFAVNQSIAELNSTNNQVDSILRQINSTSLLIKTKLEALNKRINIVQQERIANLALKNQSADIQRMIKGFTNTYQTQLTAFNTLQQQFSAYQKKLKLELGKALAKRQELPDFTWLSWQSFLAKLWLLPELIWQSSQSILQPVLHNMMGYSWWNWLLLIGYEIFLLSFWKIGRYLLKKLYTIYYHHEEPLTKNTFFVVLKLLRRNLFGLILSFNVFSLLAFNGFSFKSYALFFSFTLVWFGYRFALGLARLALLEAVRDADGQDVKLYHKLKWIYSIGAILVGLLLAARQLPVDYSVNDFINRLFMLQLLLVSGLLLRSWRVFPILLNPYFSNKQIYFARAIHWLSLLIPLALLVNAVIGLIGYVQLAWTMSAYQGLFILILLGYLFVRSLLIDSMDWISSRFVLNLPNGWLWSEAFLKPLDKLLRLCLLVLAGAFLFYLYGLDQNSYVFNIIKTAVNYPVIKLPKDQSINLLNILSAIMVVLVLAWIARWSREFSYRWLYAYQKDLGVRNSLAVFTQYITVIICVYIALEFSGKDFTGLNYILGGVSLGAGLGLRDLVNNFASGVLLLIERPVKKGDIVTVGSYEGEVTHIGMRAMTIRTWDHMEVLVPNSETFSKSFTNWTHEDMIIRTVIPIKIQRQENPYQVRDIIAEALNSVSNVLHEPAANIYMKELSEPLIQFEVRYFINIQLAGSRSRVRSEVLYAIWEAFKQHGIQPPVPPQDMQVELVNLAHIGKELYK